MLRVWLQNNPGLQLRPGLRLASGYVVGDHSNWCFQPASRWVLPAMWAVFLTIMAATLAITLYARVKLKRMPFRSVPFGSVCCSSGFCAVCARQVCAVVKAYSGY